MLDGRYPGGVLLSENELARELGISRTPVRQAFVQLEAEELLDLYPRRGALVRPVSMAEADDVLEARLLIETHCVGRVAAQGPALAAVLLEAVASQERALADGGTGFTVADREFHHAIVAANANAILVRQYDALRDRQQRITATLVARIQLGSHSSSPSIAILPARSGGETPTRRWASSTHTSEAPTRWCNDGVTEHRARGLGPVMDDGDEFQPDAVGASVAPPAVRCPPLGLAFELRGTDRSSVIAQRNFGVWRR